MLFGMFNNVNDVIEYFGGRMALARTLGVHHAAVTNWKRRGIPLKQAVRIERLSAGFFTARELCPEAYSDRPRRYGAPA